MVKAHRNEVYSISSLEVSSFHIFFEIFKMSVDVLCDVEDVTFCASKCWALPWRFVLRKTCNHTLLLLGAQLAQ
jgi:hypothetical protein